MRITFRFTFVIFALALFSEPVLAIDQLILKNGNSITGKILNETEDSVEIENQQQVRIRYLRQTIDKILKGIESEQTPPQYTFTLLGGGSLVIEKSAFSPLFAYGARISRRINGWPPAGEFHIGLSFDGNTQTVSVPTGTQTQKVNEYSVHFMLKNIDQTGAFTGLSAGEVMVVTGTNVQSIDSSTTLKRFAAGAFFGYEFKLNSWLFISPEFRIDHIFDLKNGDLGKGFIGLSLRI